jgi:hypothetical protein
LLLLLLLQVSDVPVNCITFDQLGTRLFASDAAGTLTEVSLDLTLLSAAAAAAGPGSWSQAGWRAGSSPSSCDGQPGGGGSSNGEAAASGSGGSGSSAGGQSASGSAGLVASVLRHGSTATQQLAGMVSVDRCSLQTAAAHFLPTQNGLSETACPAHLSH